MKDGTEECAIERALQCVDDLSMFPNPWTSALLERELERMRINDLIERRAIFADLDKADERAAP